MKKGILLVLLLSVANILSAQNDSLFTRQMTGILATIKTIDSSANLVKKEKFRLKQKKVKIKYYSSTDNTIKHKVIILSRNGKTYAMHKMRFGYSTKIKMTTLDDLPIFIRRRDAEGNTAVLFNYRGNAKWYFNYKVGDQTKKYFVTQDISKWR
jgi:hypothetical protein